MDDRPPLYCSGCNRVLGHCLPNGRLLVTHGIIGRRDRGHGVSIECPDCEEMKVWRQVSVSQPSTGQYINP